MKTPAARGIRSARGGPTGPASWACAIAVRAARGSRPSLQWDASPSSLNREGEPDLPEDRIRTRGALPLDALAHRPLDGLERMRGFNLVTIAAGSAEVTSWTGSVPVETTTLAPGTHMLAHDDVDDPRTARIIAWREEFARASFDEWPALLA